MVLAVLLLLVTDSIENSVSKKDFWIFKPLLSRSKRTVTDSCCFQQTCEEVPLGENNHNAIKCFQRQICGEICEQMNSKATLSATPTPGYSRKSFYINRYCSLIQCVNYKFDCSFCPDPTHSGFSIYSLSNGCVSCYY